MTLTPTSRPTRSSSCSAWLALGAGRRRRCRLFRAAARPARPDRGLRGRARGRDRHRRRAHQRARSRPASSAASPAPAPTSWLPPSARRDPTSRRRPPGRASSATRSTRSPPSSPSTLVLPGAWPPASKARFPQGERADGRSARRRRRLTDLQPIGAGVPVPRPARPHRVPSAEPTHEGGAGDRDGRGRRRARRPGRALDAGDRGSPRPGYRRPVPGTPGSHHPAAVACRSRSRRPASSTSSSYPAGRACSADRADHRHRRGSCASRSRPGPDRGDLRRDHALLPDHAAVRPGPRPRAARRGPRVAFVANASVQTVPAMVERAGHDHGRPASARSRHRGHDLATAPGRRCRIVGPVILGSIAEIEERTMALEARGFTRPGRRTLLWHPPDSGRQAVARWLLLAGGA